MPISLHIHKRDFGTSTPEAQLEAMSIGQTGTAGGVQITD